MDALKAIHHLKQKGYASCWATAPLHTRKPAAFDAGADGLVHCYNGMTGLHHREPGMVGAGLTDPRAWLELIADGHHVHPGAMRLCCCCAKDRTVLITDAMQAAGMPDGRYTLCGENVEMQGGVVRTASGGLAARSRWMPPCEIWWSIRGRPRKRYPYGLAASRPSARYGSPAGIVSTANAPILLRSMRVYTSGRAGSVVRLFPCSPFTVCSVGLTEDDRKAFLFLSLIFAFPFAITLFVLFLFRH